MRVMLVFFKLKISKILDAFDIIRTGFLKKFRHFLYDALVENSKSATVKRQFNRGRKVGSFSKRGLFFFFFYFFRFEYQNDN